MGVNVVEENSRYAMAREGRAVLLVYRDVKALVPTDAAQITTHLQKSQRQLVICSATDRGHAPPSAAYRRATLEMIRATSEHIDAFAMVFPGSGFAHAIRVSVHTSISTLMGPPPFPTKLHRTVTDAVGWLANWGDVRAEIARAMSRLDGTEPAFR